MRVTLRIFNYVAGSINGVGVKCKNGKDVWEGTAVYQLHLGNTKSLSFHSLPIGNWLKETGGELTKGKE